MQIRYEATKGSDPLVRVTTNLEEDLIALKRLFLSLANMDPPSSMSLRRLAWIDFVNIGDFVLRRVQPSERPVPTIRLAERRAEPAIIDWSGDREDWVTRAELVEGLFASPEPGHQYLTGYESLDPIEVEVSFREGSEE